MRLTKCGIIVARAGRNKIAFGGQTNMGKRSDPVISQVLNERNQGHDTRRRLYARLETMLGRPVVAYFTSFRFPVMIEDTDADMLAGVLQKLDLSKGLALMISSPGGDILAAERIVNVCRSCSDTGEYWVVVPGKAKSAATMICFGASKVYMGATSELGPVDPQLTVVDGDEVKWFSAHSVVKSYDDLFERAVKEEGNLEPYLQQLQNFDAREITELRNQIGLSQDIAVKTLSSGMMKGKRDEEIKEGIQLFLTPDLTKTHGRPILREDAKKCGLAIEDIDSRERLWPLVYELYIRIDQYVSTSVAKCIESKRHSFQATYKRGSHD